MNWLNLNIKVVSVAWWLIQSILLLINEIRVFCEYTYVMFPFLAISIGLLIVSLLLWIIQNSKIIIFLGIILLFYSIVSLIFLSLLFVIESHGNYLAGLFLFIPIINILLSVVLLRKYYLR